MSEPSLDIVLAATPGMAQIEQALWALESQRAAVRSVILVSNFHPPARLAERFPWVTWRVAPADSLVPELWGQGVREAQADVVALTTAQFVPASDWACAIRGAHSRMSAVGIGGAIDPPCGQGLVAWAEYFLRYHSLFRLDHEQAVADFPGDNGTYKRSAIAERAGDGFWEHEIHRDLRRRGQILVWTPEIRVAHRAGPGFVRFVQQRFAHGWRFGCKRTEQNGELWRHLALLAAPVLPLVFLTKIARCVIGRGDHWLPFCLSLPVLLLFLCSWCLGEAGAYALYECAPADTILAAGGRS